MSIRLRRACAILAAVLSVRLLGPPQPLNDQGPLNVPGRKSRALVCYMLARKIDDGLLSEGMGLPLVEDETHSGNPAGL